MKQIQFTISTQNTDGSTMTPAQVAALTFAVMIDTVNPPLKSYPVPAAQVMAAVNGVVTVTPAQLGFTPIPGTTYFVDATETSGAQTSAPSNVAQYAEAPSVPKPPANLAVS